jgi:SAM-dependent methyltransferase
MPDITPWYEQDSFWEIVEPFMFAQQLWSDAPAEVDKVIALLGLQPGMSVLDLCCGVGRHALEFARRGYQVIGVDRTQVYLDKARRQATSEGLEIDFILADMRTFCKPGAFDAIINLFTSFGYFEDPMQDRQVVLNIHRSLKTNGSLLMDLMGKEVLARIFQERDWHEKEGILILKERRLSQAWSWVENRWIMIKDGNRYEFRYSNRLYSAAELTSLLTGCGFNSIEVYGDFSGGDYDQLAKRLVVIAHR